MFLQMDLAPELSRRPILMAYPATDTAERSAFLSCISLFKKGLLSSPAVHDILSESI